MYINKQHINHYPLNRIIPAFVVFIMMNMVSIQAYTQPENAEESTTFSHAKTILNSMSNYLGSAEQFSFQATMTEDIRFTKDIYIQTEITSKVIVKRPDKVFADIKSDYNHKRYWYDGQNITLLSIPQNYYATASATGNIDSMADSVYNKFGVHIPLVALAFENTFEALMEGVQDGYYAGLHSVDGILCHHLLFLDDDTEWQIWIEDGPNPDPRKYVVKYSMDDRDYLFVAMINNWDFNEYAPDEMFNFIAPFGSVPIEFINLSLIN
jgi:hypothetical protein